MHAMIGKLQPLREYFIGEIVDYVTRKPEPEREMLSLRRWHLLHVLTGQECKVAEEIENNGMAAYLPRIERKERGRGGHHHRMMKRALYPGYLFVGFDPSGERWHSIKDIDGVIRLFMADFSPIAIPWTVVARIQDVCRNWQIERDKGMLATVQIGNTVRIVDHGGFTGLFGEVLQVDDAKRFVRIDLELFKRIIPMWLPEGKFEVV